MIKYNGDVESRIIWNGGRPGVAWSVSGSRGYLYGTCESEHFG